MLELENITEIDLKGILFTEFPVELLFDEAKERLELLILECYEHLFEDDEDAPKPTISPFWIEIALRRKNTPKFKSEQEREKAVKIARARRKWIWERARVIAPDAKGNEFKKALRKATDQYDMAILNRQLKES